MNTMGILELETHKELALENIKIFSERKYKELTELKHTITEI